MEYFEFLKEGGFPLLSAFIMGLVVIACPCTIASNVTILTSMLNRNVSASMLFSKACIYVLGRMVAYLGIAYLLYSFSEIIAVSESIQNILGLLLGPLFLLVGISIIQCRNQIPVMWPYRILFPRIGLTIARIDDIDEIYHSIIIIIVLREIYP